MLCAYTFALVKAVVVDFIVQGQVNGKCRMFYPSLSLKLCDEYTLRSIYWFSESKGFALKWTYKKMAETTN